MILSTPSDKDDVVDETRSVVEGDEFFAVANEDA